MSKILLKKQIARLELEVEALRQINQAQRHAMVDYLELEAEVFRNSTKECGCECDNNEPQRHKHLYNIEMSSQDPKYAQLEEEHEALKISYSKLQIAEESRRKDIEHCEDTLTKTIKELEDANDQIKATREEVKRLKKEAADREEHINYVEKKCEETIADNESELKELRPQIERLRNLNQDKKVLEDERREREVKELGDYRKLLDQFAAEQALTRRLEEQLQVLTVELEKFQKSDTDCGTDLEEQVALTKMVVDHVRKLAEDTPQFDASVDAYVDVPKPSTPLREEAELSDVESCVEDSTDDEDDGAACPGPPGPPGDPVVVYVDKEVFKTEYINRWYPISIASHNPLYCWFHVERNILVLIWGFFFQFIPAFTEIHPDAPPADEHPIDVPDEDTTADSQEEEIETSGDSPENPDVSDQSAALAENPRDPELEDFFNIKNAFMPPILPTLLAFFFHLIAYALLYVAISCYFERNMWLAADDSARRYVANYWAYNSRYASYGFRRFFVSDRMAGHMDRLVLNMVKSVGVQMKPYALPG